MSLAIIVPTADKQAANEALEQAGYGSNNISVPMRGPVRVDDPEQATHWGCHWWAGQELNQVVEIVKTASESARFLANVEREGIEQRETIGFEMFDGEAGEYFYMPIDPRLIDGLNHGLGMLTGNGRAYAQKLVHEREWPILEFRERDIVPISLQGDPRPLQQVLMLAVEAGGLTEEEVQQIVGGVQQAAGHEVNLKDFIPASWLQWIMPRKLVQQMGYKHTDDSTDGGNQ